MISTLRVLDQIQKIDLEIKAIEEEQKRYERLMEELGGEIAAASQAASAMDAELEGLRAQLKEIEERIRESSERVSKDEKRLGSVKNDRELSAITKEINGANKARKQGEQEKTALDSRLGERLSALDARKQALSAKEEELKRLSGEVESKKEAWKEAVEGKLRSREEVKAAVRPDILRKYEMIRSRRGGLGIVQVKDEICQGCFTHIPPQVYIMLKKGTEELQSCPHCHRLLFAETQAQLEAV